MPTKCVCLRTVQLAALVLPIALTSPLSAAPILTGATGGISMGVAPYGAPIDNGAPTYIPNNFTGRNDILSSPGLGTLGGYQTANPVIANNIASIGPGALPATLTQVGGGNAAGAFGAASAINAGNVMGFALADSGAGGGTASYLISTAELNFTDVAGTAAGTTYGAYMALGGAVPLVGNADVAALMIHIDDSAGVFGVGGENLPQLVMAISRNGAGSGLGNYNIVLDGQSTALIVTNGALGTFNAAVIDNLVLPAALPAGDLLTVSATLTAYSDPASFDTIDLTPDLLSLTGPLPSFSFVSTEVVPEPATVLLVCGALAALGLFRRLKVFAH